MAVGGGRVEIQKLPIGDKGNLESRKRRWQLSGLPRPTDALGGRQRVGDWIAGWVRYRRRNTEYRMRITERKTQNGEYGMKNEE
jgi:hypothetical protein